MWLWGVSQSESINGAVLCVGETQWGSCAQGVVPVDIEKREEYPKLIFVY